MAAKITKEASVFYFTYALLRASKYYLQYLIDSKSVSGTIKANLRNISNRINDLDRTAKNDLDEKDYSEWQREWTDKDYEVFASVFSEMNDMDEGKRRVLEEFAKELSKGNVRVEIDSGQGENDERSVATKLNS